MTEIAQGAILGGGYRFLMDGILFSQTWGTEVSLKDGSLAVVLHGLWLAIIGHAPSKRTAGAWI